MQTMSEAEFDAWAITVDADGNTRPATKSELHQRSVLVLDRGDGLVRVLVTALDSSKDGRRHAALGLPGTVERVSPVASKAWAQIARALPPAARARVMLADVYRAPGHDLRDEVSRETGRTVRARQRAEPEVIARARELAADPEHPAERRRVRMADLEDGDVIEATDLPPVRIQGEAR